MVQNKKSLLLGAAVAGMMGAGTLMTASSAVAADKAVTTGHCMGANACAGKGACAQAPQHDCATKNGCKGKGYTETTKADCNNLAKKNKMIHFEAVKSKS
jgi:hypothetical protein